MRADRLPYRRRSIINLCQFVKSIEFHNVHNSVTNIAFCAYEYSVRLVAHCQPNWIWNVDAFPRHTVLCIHCGFSGWWHWWMTIVVDNFCMCFTHGICTTIYMWDYSSSHNFQWMQQKLGTVLAMLIAIQMETSLENGKGLDHAIRVDRFLLCGNFTDKFTEFFRWQKLRTSHSYATNILVLLWNIIQNMILKKMWYIEIQVCTSFHKHSSSAAHIPHWRQATLPRQAVIVNCEPERITQLTTRKK